MSLEERLRALRSAMAELEIDAYLIPSNDPHQSEYVAEHWMARTWLSGFTGSAGLLIVTAEHAGLWTDSRYFIQAEKELAGSPVVLEKQEVPHAPEHIDWLLEHVPEGGCVGFDGKLFSVRQVRGLSRRLFAKNIELYFEDDLVSEIWADRPPLPQAPVFEHEVRYAGKSRPEKLEEVRKAVREKGGTHYFVSTLDDIAWVLNLRGRDVDFNPVFYAYLIIGLEIATLYIQEEKVPAAIREALAADGVFIKPYASIGSDLERFSDTSDVELAVDQSSVSIALYNLLDPQRRIHTPNFIGALKAIKNDTEIRHFRQTMRKDAVALVSLFRWLEAQLAAGEEVTEYTLAMQLIEFRSRQEGYFGESFAAIAGYEGNGAIVHYRPAPQTAAVIRQEGILLLDSGGQYLDGTTDITRTIALGEPTTAQRMHYTLVLKGNIALDQARFPEGTTGVQLDTLARQYLWQSDLNYGHGTGHGVGFFLNVHEPPQGFATNPVTSRGTTAIVPGMVTSNEPGFYLEDQYGIRIENLILCVEAQASDFGKFFKFETLTLFPIDTRLIEPGMLHREEVEWLNAYHARVLEEVGPLLDPEERQWLAAKCRPLEGVNPG